MNDELKTSIRNSFIIMHSSFIIILDRPGGKEEKKREVGVRFPGGLPAFRRAKFIDILEETKIELRRWKSSSKVGCEKLH